MKKTPIYEALNKENKNVPLSKDILQSNYKFPEISQALTLLLIESVSSLPEGNPEIEKGKYMLDLQLQRSETHHVRNTIDRF